MAKKVVSIMPSSIGEQSSSSSDTIMDEDKQYLLRNGLMFEDAFSRHGSRGSRWLNWNVGALVANVLLLIAGVAVGLGNSSNDAWKRLMPPGDGIVEIPNEHTYDLPPSLPAPNSPNTSKVYGISMFHQLHCLSFIRYAYEPESIKDYPADEVVYHRDHCIDYIRQAIMSTHMCRSYDKMFAWAYKHRSDKKDDGYPPGKVTHTPADRNMLESPQSHVHGDH
ncbi:hypothetical protein QBC32DRAFT_374782 [Pseudoneurospora amorphoporcata]|uniref:Oxidase ustYa n=1 Tax=Pseudoneurospora amorphoporcata TaxID=241081 RepID=A0AAN6NN35_9PEZI|nr:hypothetical protein QBC32DRAFT_374782 [Pseudoneurospora amorphoporcata]